MGRREIFKRACYAPDLQSYYVRCIEDGVLSRQEFSVSYDGSLAHVKFDPSRMCRACKKDVLPDDFDVFVGYFTDVWYPCHRQCREGQTRYEHRECQMIDMNCNDCRHLRRKPMASGVQVLSGECVRLKKDVSFLPRTCMPQNASCFEHRI